MDVCSEVKDSKASQKQTVWVSQGKHTHYSPVNSLQVVLCSPSVSSCAPAVLLLCSCCVPPVFPLCAPAVLLLCSSCVPPPPPSKLVYHVFFIQLWVFVLLTDQMLTCLVMRRLPQVPLSRRRQFWGGSSLRWPVTMLSEDQLLEQRTSVFSAAKHQSPGLEVLSSSLTLRAEPWEEPEPPLDQIKATNRTSEL